jgi:hypothetical protein
MNGRNDASTSKDSAKSGRKRPIKAREDGSESTGGQQQYVEWRRRLMAPAAFGGTRRPSGYALATRGVA